MDGIQIHPHDILDEGTEIVLKHVKDMGGIRYIFPQVNTIFERNPYPVGTLTHNPVRDFVMGKGTFHASLDMQSISPKLYQEIDLTIENGEDPLGALKDATKNTNYEVIPWFNILNGNFKGNFTANAVRNIFGEVVPYWLCSNGPDVLEMWKETFKAFIEKYEYHTFMIDRIRYPDWAGETTDPSRMFSCFCSICKEKMSQCGINLTALQKDILSFIEVIKEKDYFQAVDVFRKSPHISQWVHFRQNSISNFVKRFVDEVSSENRKVKVWLDLWPPSYAWFLGQDYDELTKYASVLKHFPYHKLGGGADVQGLIEYIGDRDQEKEDAFKAFLHFFEIDQEISYETFQQQGFEIDFVHKENQKVRKSSQPQTIIYSGVQAWNIDHESLRETIEVTRQSAADHLLYYCYGWAEIEHFKVISEMYSRE